MLTGWGRYKKYNISMLKPKNLSNLQTILNNKIKSKNFIVRGFGRSYGDSSIGENVICLSNFKKKIQLDKKKKTVRCTSNVSIEELINFLLKKKLFIKVTSGTKYVTIGGSIASDIHGKNHHLEGSFCDHVMEIELMTVNGKIIKCSKKKNSKLFFATCGGMGLTGIILSAIINIKKIPSTKILQTTIKTNSLNETLKKFDEYKKSNYLVAWFDTNKTGKELGRAIIYLGEHVNSSKKISKNFNFSIPFVFPNFFLNSFIFKMLSQIFFFITPNFKKELIDIRKYFYPLDNIRNWNNLYGNNGFVQIQFLVNEKKALNNIKKLLLFFQDKKQVSFLSTIKKMGKKNQNYLSFPNKGYTITFDIKVNKNLHLFYAELEKILLSMKATIYLTKDSLMTKKFFLKSSKNFVKFINVKKKYDPNFLLTSFQSKRIGLDR